MKIIKRFKKTIAVILLLLVIIFVIFVTDFSSDKKPAWGVTFSRSYALDLQLDWQETYLAILDDLKVSHIRLSAYWDEIEAKKDQYNFSNLDWQIDQATEHDIKIILAIGRRLPRWPECHDPAWVKHYPQTELQNETLELLKLLVNRYKDNQAIVSWQIENEPLFTWFGFCPPPSEKFLAQEVNLVRSLDSSRDILLTDSGELSSWRGVAKYGDVIGTTLYRIVWNKTWGFFEYWFIPPAFYRWKADLTHFFHPNIKKIIVTELQMEPWTFDRKMVELTIKEQEKSFDLKRFQKNIKYAQATGFPEIYLWGVEYWYWLKEQGQPAVWQEAQKLWR